MTDPITPSAESSEAPAIPARLATPSFAVLAGFVQFLPSMAVVFALPGLEIVHANPAARRQLVMGEEPGFGGRRLSDLVGLASVRHLDSEILPQARVVGLWAGDCELRDTRGSEFVAHATFFLQRDGNGTAFLCLHAVPVELAVDAACTSFTDQVLLQALLDTLPETVYFKDTCSRFVRISRSQATKLGVSDPGAVIGRTDFDFFSVAHASSAFADERRILATGEPVIDKEELETWDDGRQAWVSTTKLVLCDRAGKVIGTFGISHDITARKAAEETRRQMEAKQQLSYKLESLGRLAAGVAHEINTPTQYITDNTHFMTDAFAKIQALLVEYRAMRSGVAACLEHHPVASGLPTHLSVCAKAVGSIARMEAEVEIDYLLTEIPRCLQQSLDGLSRVGHIVRSLKEFAHPNSPELTPSDLNRTIETAIAVSRHEWKYVADVVTELAPELPPVPCVVDEINQTLLNLIVNAAHAIEEAVKGRPSARGKITIRSRHEAAEVVVEVEDTGTGIPDAVRSQIFEPFFTTKPVGKGSGQGLAIVHTVIVKHHHGSIDVKTAVGQGTTFILRLPLCPRTAAVAAAPADGLPL